MAPVLIMAATELELGPLLGVLSGRRPVELPHGSGVAGALHGVDSVLIWTGLGKVNAAAATSASIDRLTPRVVVQVGVGGAFEGWDLAPGDVAVAGEEVHLDLGVRLPDDFLDLDRLGFPLLGGRRLPGNRLPLDPRLAAELAGDLARVVPFGTSETVTGDAREAAVLGGRTRVAVESMEGAAAAQVALSREVPFAEVRGISNRVAERDRAAWRLEEAVEAACETVGAWLARGATIPAGTWAP